MHNRTAMVLLLFNLALGACAATQPVAPQPLEAIYTSRFFNGRWYEIARTPMKLTDGCVSGTTDYYTRPDGQLMDRDACRMGSPEGKEKVYAGPVKILNPGENNKVRVTYKVYGFFPVWRTYWMLDVDDDYRWFIVSDPSFENMSLFFRDPRPDAGAVSAVMRRATALGYDVDRLEMPERFPVGQK
jgi:apolipoprotein D and lipocalin family protein